jgi:hypothetical protein
MNAPVQPIDDAEAIRTILDTLKRLPADERAGVLRYVQEKLAIAVPTPGTAAPEPHPGAGGARSNIRSFVETKKPSSDVQFAAAVAYFHAFEAPQGARKPEIVGDDLTEAARQANWERLKKPIQTLHNATKLGYFDKGSARGAFKINTVGENLVAMAMPPTAAVTAAPRRRGKKSAKPK